MMLVHLTVDFNDFKIDLGLAIMICTALTNNGQVSTPWNCHPRFGKRVSNPICRSFCMQTIES